MIHPSGGRFAALRLCPGDDLIGGLEAALAEMGAQAAALVTCVGSLTEASLRFADRPDGTALEGPFEIVSLIGTLEPAGWHLHAALSDAEGRVVGGHLMPGCPVRTTAEIVMVLLDDLRFARRLCPLSGYRELDIR